jgi:hypothetical protein
MVVSPDSGRRVLEVVLGNELLEEAVELVADYRVGSSAAESLLGVVRSRHATEYCYRRRDAECDPEKRRGFAHALRCCAHSIALSWIDSLWTDPDENVEILASKMLEGMINANAVDEEQVQFALLSGSTHHSPAVREYVGYAQAAFDRRFGSPCDP